MANKTSKTPAQRHKKIEHWDDERSQGNSLIVTLKPGWKFSDDSLAVEHVRGFDTQTQAMKEVRAAIHCECAECPRLLSKKPA